MIRLPSKIRVPIANYSNAALLFLVFVVVTALVVAASAQRRFPTADEMSSHLAEGKCSDCHAAIFAEWLESGHAAAWTSPLYQESRRAFDHVDKCDPCHAPRPVLITGTSEFPRIRDRDRQRGVDCLTCHLDASGAMHGPYGDRSPFHKIERDTFLYSKSISLCETCHGQETVMAHNQVAEYRTSSSYRQGQTCQLCHMPELIRKPSRYSRSEKRSTDHSFPGSRSEARLRNTVRLDFEDTSEGVKVYLTNAAGHRIPAAPLREIRLDIRLTSVDGGTLGMITSRFRHPLDVDGTPMDPALEDDRPRPGEFREYFLPVGRADLAQAFLDVRVRYRRSDVDEWVTMSELEHRFP